MPIASKCSRDFDCDWQRVNAFSHCVTLIRNLLSQIISYSDAKVQVLVVMERKRANEIYVYKLIFLLHTSRSTETTLMMHDSMHTFSTTYHDTHTGNIIKSVSATPLVQYKW